MERSKLLKIGAVLMAVLLLISVGVYADEASDIAAAKEEAVRETLRAQAKADQMEEINNLKDEYNDLEDKLKELNREIEKANANLSDKKAQRAKIQKQIELIQEQIDNLIERIELLNQDIEAREIEIVNLEMTIDDCYTKFEHRLRASQVTGSTTNWELLFGAKSLSEFLSAVQTIKRIAEYDNGLIAELKESKKEVEAQRAALQKDREEVEALKADADEKRKELDSKLAQVQDSINSINTTLQQTEKSKKETEAEMAEKQQEIDNIYKQLEFDENYVGGEFLWPSKSFTKLTSTYGWRSWSNGASDFHTGIDIAGAGIYGTDILAANAGKVAYVKTTYVAGKGYGKYLIVDHGGGYSTLYAHCSSISVKVGDTVKRGQVIAKVGSTGNSTGPHIHFEIRVNSKHQDPLLWFPNVKK